MNQKQYMMYIAGVLKFHDAQIQAERDTLNVAKDKYNQIKEIFDWINNNYIDPTIYSNKEERLRRAIEYFGKEELIKEFNIENYDQLVHIKDELEGDIKRANEIIKLHEKIRDSAKFDNLYFFKDYADYEYMDFNDYDYSTLDTESGALPNHLAANRYTKRYNFEKCHELHPEVSPVEYKKNGKG